MGFDAWQRWGIDLDDRAFANAWAALGLALDREDGFGNRLRSLYELERKTWSGNLVRWSFPAAATLVDATPREWAEAWPEAWARMYGRRVRLNVRNAPSQEPILPWLRLLRESDPKVAAVSLSLESSLAELHIEWPLRIGCLSADTWTALAPLHKDLWPSSEQARLVLLGRDNGRCDVLVYQGSPRTLLAELLRAPWEVKANVILLIHRAEGAWGRSEACLSSILAETRASGFVMLPQITPKADLAPYINHVVREMAHGLPLDVAVTSDGDGRTIDLVAAFTSEALKFELPQLADRYNARLAALPPGSTLDMSKVGKPDEWLTRGVNTREPLLGAPGVIAGGTLKGVQPGTLDDERQIRAADLHVDASELFFDHEHEGATTLAQVGTALNAASPPPEALTKRAARFLQQRSFVRTGGEFREAKHGFVAGAPALVCVRIAEPEVGWDALPTTFPVEKLPQHLESWTLTVWLSEPDHLTVPLKRNVELPRDGNSSECEFHFRAGTNPRFVGRLTVLHRNRVIQTALLDAAVLVADEVGAEDGSPKLDDPVVVRRHLGDLAQRRPYDRAYVVNRDKKGRPLLTAVSSRHAWVKDLSRMGDLTGALNGTLSRVAKSVEDYAAGLDGEKGEALLVQLAQHGGTLKVMLAPELEDPANNAAVIGEEYIQLVATKMKPVVPLEFVYDFQPPADGARVCPQWRKAVTEGKCAETCDHRSNKIVCPMGFWGMQKTIERHVIRPGLAKDGSVLYLQSEPADGRSTLYLGGAAVLGASTRVTTPSLRQLEAVLARQCGTAPKLAITWDDWETVVKEFRPNLLVALPHTGGTGTNVTVEIGNNQVKTVSLTESHVFPPPCDGRMAPLVALLGCDVNGTADDYGNHVEIFRDRGAAIVIGTIATVFGDHAARVAQELIEGLLPDDNANPVRLGDVISTIRRKALLADLLMPLCVVAYGDADWLIARKEASDV